VHRPESSLHPHWLATLSPRERPHGSGKRFHTYVVMTEKGQMPEKNDEASWSSYESPAGFFRIRYPPDWSPSREENILNLFPPWGTGAVTVSAFGRSSADPVPLKDLLLRSFREAQPLSELNTLAVNNWAGWNQEFRTREQSADLHWIAVAAEAGKAFLLITAYDLPNSMAEHKPTYLKIIRSLEIRPPS